MVDVSLSLKKASLGVPVQAQSNGFTLNMAVGLGMDEQTEIPNKTEQLLQDQQDAIQAIQVELTATDYNDASPTATKNMDHYINTAFIVGVLALVAWKVMVIDGDISRGWSIGELATRVPMAAWTSYSKVLASDPILTKAATSASVYTIGDIIAQRSTGTAMGDLDRMRTLRSMLAGLIGHGPMSHLWYHFSDNLFINVLHCTAWWSFVPKILIDQTLWGPIWNNSYIIMLGLMKRDSIGTVWDDMKRTTFPLFVSGLKLWPLAHCVTYGLIPTENRLLWVDLVEIVWVTILAQTAAEAAEHHDGTKAAEAVVEPVGADQLQ
jgi:protein Mpv17